MRHSSWVLTFCNQKTLEERLRKLFLGQGVLDLNWKTELTSWVCSCSCFFRNLSRMMWARKASQVDLGIFGLSMIIVGNFSVVSFMVVAGIIISDQKLFFVLFWFQLQLRRRELSQRRQWALAEITLTLNCMSHISWFDLIAIFISSQLHWLSISSHKSTCHKVWRIILELKWSSMKVWWMKYMTMHALEGTDVERVQNLELISLLVSISTPQFVTFYKMGHLCCQTFIRYADVRLSFAEMRLWTNTECNLIDSLS